VNAPGAGRAFGARRRAGRRVMADDVSHRVIADDVSRRVMADDVRQPGTPFIAGVATEGVIHAAWGRGCHVCVR
jgi:hypothetical protein